MNKLKKDRPQEYNRQFYDRMVKIENRHKEHIQGERQRKLHEYFEIFSDSNLPTGAKKRSGPPKFPLLCCSSVTLAITNPPEPLSFFNLNSELIFPINHFGHLSIFLLYSNILNQYLIVELCENFYICIDDDF